MRIVFMGTPEFAVASLNLLVRNKYNVVAVVTAPDRPAGRGQVLSESAVKKFANENRLKILQPVNLKDEQFISELRALKPDLLVVVAFRMLPSLVWMMPPLGTFNLHASLLPKYRGAAPINWAIIKGEKKTGITTFRIDREIDTGNILLQEEVLIGEYSTAGELHNELMKKGAELMLRSVRIIEDHFVSGTPLHFIPQDNREASHAPKLYKETCRINWENGGGDIFNHIRGLSPEPGAYTRLTGGNGTLRTLKIFRAKFEKTDHKETNGSLITDNRKYLKIYCNGGLLEVIELQLEGKKRMQTEEFLKGFKLESGMFLI